MKNLHLPMKRKWFEMIACGEKKEEYRALKDYWGSRLCYKVHTPHGGYLTKWMKLREGDFECLKDDFIPNFEKFDRVIAKNGYSKTSPIIHWEHLGISIGEPNPSWCEPQDVGKKVFILKIGDIFYDSRR